ncbi:MAG TPA: hypothetical protein VK919_00110 [Solirubrobacterales bacterium]|nr:hypothetical protein [Solirubrobacterales bacterium]
MSEHDPAAEPAAEAPAPEGPLEEAGLEPEAPGAAPASARGRRRAIGATAAAGDADPELAGRLGATDVRTRAAMIARLQGGRGNAVVVQRLGAGRSGAVLQREDAGAGVDADAEEELPPELLSLASAGFAPLAAPAGAAPSAGAGAAAEPLRGGEAAAGGEAAPAPGSGGARPPARVIEHECADCNAAVAHVNSGAYLGEASVQIAPAAGEIRVSGSGSAFTAEVDIAWPIDVAASSMEVTNFTWPNMSSADAAAVDAFRDALLAHEEGHFIEVEAILAGQPAKLTATGRTRRAAAEALQTRAREALVAAQSAIEQATTDYDSRTNHGRTQSAVGGTDVHLQCPRVAAEEEGAAPGAPTPGGGGPAADEAAAGLAAAQDAAERRRVEQVAGQVRRGSGLQRRRRAPRRGIQRKAPLSSISPGISNEIKDMSNDQKLAKVRELLDGGGSSHDVAYVWASFGDQALEIARSDPETFKRSVDAAGMMIADLKAFGELRDRFKSDVEGLALAYTSQNRDYVAKEIERIGVTEAEHGGTPSAEQQHELRELQKWAELLADCRDVMGRLRATPVGYEPEVIDAPGGGFRSYVSVATFNPDSPPAYRERPGSIPWAHGAEEASRTAKFKPWEAVKAQWDEVAKVKAVAEMRSPTLGYLGREGDPRAFAEADLADARTQAGQALNLLIGRIEKAVPLIGAEIDYNDLVPIHDQLFAGAQGASGINWSLPVEQAIARRHIEAADTAAMLAALGLGALQAAVFLFAPFASVGMAAALIGFGIGIGIGQATMSWDRYSALKAGSEAFADPRLAILSKEKADSALFTAIIDTAFAFVDASGAPAALRAAGRSLAEAGEVGARASAELALRNLGKQAGEGGARAVERAVLELGPHEASRISGRSYEQLAEIVGKESATGKRLMALAGLGPEAAQKGVAAAADKLKDLAKLPAGEANEAVLAAIDQIGVLGTLRRGGGWKAVTGAVGEGSAAAGRLEAWRQGLMEELKRFLAETDEVTKAVRTGTERATSDLDIQAVGGEAALNAERGKQWLAARVGCGKEELKHVLDATIFVDPTRAHLHQVIQGLSEADRAAIDAASSGLQQRLQFASRLAEAEAKGDAKLAAEITAEAAERGIADLKPFKPFTDAEQAAMARQIDGLVNELESVTDPARRAQLVKEIGEKQAMINASNPEAYLGGGVRFWVTGRPGDVEKLEAAGAKLLSGPTAAQRIVAALDEGKFFDQAMAAARKPAQRLTEVADALKDIGKHGARACQVTGVAGGASEQLAALGARLELLAKAAKRADFLKALGDPQQLERLIAHAEDLLAEARHQVRHGISELDSAARIVEVSADDLAKLRFWTAFDLKFAAAGNAIEASMPAVREALQQKLRNLEEEEAGEETGAERADVGAGMSSEAAPMSVGPAEGAPVSRLARAARGDRRVLARRGPPPPEFIQYREIPDASARLVEDAEKLEREKVPELQAAIDGLDEGGIARIGREAALLYSTIEGSYSGAPRTVERGRAFEDAKQALAGTLGPQTFRGQSLGEVPEDYAEGDLAAATYRHAAQMAWVAKDANALLDLLELLATEGHLTEEEEWRCVGLIRQHPNPWHVAWMRAAVHDAGLADWMETGFVGGAAEGMGLTLHAAERLAAEGKLAPGEEVAKLEVLPSSGMVRVVTPTSPRELATELYGEEAVGMQLLTTYNRNVVSGVGAEGWIRAGTELAVDPGLLAGHYRTVFAAVGSTRYRADRPFLEGSTPGAAVTGTTGRYLLQWPEPPVPKDTPVFEGKPLFQSTRSRVNYIWVYWWVENDPEAVAQGLVPEREHPEDDRPRPLGVEELGTDDAAFEHEWKVPGTHVVHCELDIRAVDDLDRTSIELALGGTELDLRQAQPVASLGEVTEIEWMRVEDPRRIVVFGEQTFAEAAHWREEMERRGMPILPPPEEEPATEGAEEEAPKFLKGDPRGLLERLREQRRALPGDEDMAEELDKQIEALDKLIERTGETGLRQVEGIYVAEEERSTAIQLQLYAGFDPDDPLSVAVWDFTLPGPPRSYRSFGYDAGAALREALDEFADDAPYPDGNVRVTIGSWLLEGERDIPSETLTLKTDGGMILDDILRWVAMGALAVALVFPPVALPALVVSGVAGGIAGGMSIHDRLEHGDFEWDLETGLDVLDIAGAVTAGAGAVASATVRGVGRLTMIARVGGALDVVEIGVLGASHLGEIQKASATGDPDKVANALLRALGEGALYAVVHARARQISRAGAPAEGPDVPRFDIPGVEPPSRTARGTTRGGEPEGPGGRAAEEPLPESADAEAHRTRHEEWAQRVRETGLGPRDPVGPAAGPPLKAGTFADGIETPDAAIAKYDEALARAGGREVGIFRNIETGRYAVRVGTEHGVSAPLAGRWETVLHRHPNPENVLTRRMPAPHDVQETALAAWRAGKPITEFIDFQYPDGRRGLSAYTVDPDARTITIEWERPDGTRARRTVGSLQEYADMYCERTTHVDPSSPEYEWIMRDLDDFYKHRSPSGPTAVGAARLGEASAAPRDLPVQLVTPAKVGGRWTGFPDTVPEGVVLEFPGGERVWRTEAGIGIESKLGPAPGRAGYERELPSRGQYADPGYQEALYELAHSQGQGTGFESPYGIRLAPREVNQRLQRWGIEEYLYRLRDEYPDLDFHLITDTRSVEGSTRLAEIQYRVDATWHGERRRLFEFGIQVEGSLAQPDIKLVDPTIWDADLVDMLGVDMGDVHARFELVDLASLHPAPAPP